jgi:endonuclease YncB( thermonuclease family)
VTRLLFVLAMTVMATAVLADPIEPADVRVVDGDTIEIFHMPPNVRLVGFNAPESDAQRAKCEAERQLGIKAADRLREIVKAGHLDYEPVACSCRAGTEGTMACNYARECGTLKAGGRDVGAILIGERLAVQFACGKTRCPKTPRPWCG